ncbi:MAG TPA: helix-turn-helix domain-containing protein [Acidimicrobiales bacterium]|nr:helix-turn-helix domain-containing protein [Acidimicrobiales bacterium]
MSRPRAKPAPQPGAPRSRKGVRTRARLIEAARDVFEEAGFLDARISDIAERAGLSHGSFYHYFDSKEQIFREVAEAQEARLTARPPAADAGEQGDPPDATEGPESSAPPASAASPLPDRARIERANRRYFEQYRESARIMGVIEEVSRYDQPVNEARRRRQQHFAERAEAAIRGLQAEGAADADVDPEIAALALGAMVARFAELWLVDGWGDFEFDHAVEQITRLWANAVGLDATPPLRSRTT